MKVCSVEGCDGTFKVVKGMCNKHYLRMRRNGTVVTTRTEKGAARNFLESLVGHTGSECVTWPFATHKGYARINEGGENVPAYRIMCEMAHGPSVGIENHATHNCGKGNLGCINPNHLEWGTRFKNQQDRVEHGTSNRGEQCAAHKLTTEQVAIIFARLNAGEGLVPLALEFGVSPATIRDIKLGLSWAWLTGLQNPKERDRMGNLVAANDNVAKAVAA